jgi:hypothetical protein
MPTQVTINDITGATPFDVYICDDPITSCVYVDTINSFPLVFNLPTIMDGQSSYTLKIVDDNGCTITEILTP